MISHKVKRIILIGFRGVGKSTTGKLLAKNLGWQYISTDDEIEEKEGKPINSIVRKKGWEYFRKLETEVINECLESNYVVMDTGGGVVENEKVMERLIKASTVVWLDANIEDIYHRLRNHKNRPLLNQNDWVDDIKINYEKRMPIYQRYSDFRFNTSIERVEEICNKIISEMR